MAAPTIAATTNNMAGVTSGTLALTLQSHASGDIIFVTVVLWAPNTAGTLNDFPTPTDSAGGTWTQIASVNHNDDGRVAWYWLRATGTSHAFSIGYPSGADTGTDGVLGAASEVISGCIATGTPHDTPTTGGPHTAASQNCPVVEVEGTERLAVINVGIMDNTSPFSAISGYTVQTNKSITTGTDAGTRTAYQNNVSTDRASTATNISAPVNAGSAYVFLGVAFKPPVGANVSGTAAGTVGPIDGTASGTGYQPGTAAGTVGPIDGAATGTATAGGGISSLDDLTGLVFWGDPSGVNGGAVTLSGSNVTDIEDMGSSGLDYTVAAGTITQSPSPQGLDGLDFGTGGGVGMSSAVGTNLITGTVATVVLVCAPRNSANRGVCLRSTGQGNDWDNAASTAMSAESGVWPSGYRNVVQLATTGTDLRPTWPDWHTVIVVFDGTDNLLYVDGVLEDTVGSTGTFNVDWIAVGHLGGGTTFQGIMGEWGVFDRDLDSGEVDDAHTHLTEKWITGGGGPPEVEGTATGTVGGISGTATGQRTSPLPLVEDWTGTDNDPWPDRWTARTVGSSTIDDTIQGNAGELTVDTTDVTYAFGSMSANVFATDVDLLVSWQAGQTTESYPEVMWRIGGHASGEFPASGYAVEVGVAADTVALANLDAGGGIAYIVNVGTAGVTDVNVHWLRVLHVGDEIKVRWWDDGDPEPSSWQIDETDTDWATGDVVLGLYGDSGGNARTVTFDDLLVQSPAPVVEGTASGTVGGISGTVTGTSYRPGVATGTVGGISGVATGTRSGTGTATGTVGPINGAATSQRRVSGAVAGTVGPITGAAVGVVGVTVTGTAAGTVGPLNGSANAAGGIVGTATGVVGPIDGTVTAKRTVVATVAGTVGPINGAATGRRSTTGTAAGAVGPISGNADATGAGNVTGSASGTVGGISGAASGTPTTPGTATGTVGGIGGTAVAVRGIAGVLVGQVGGISGTAVGRRSTAGTATGVVGPIVGTASGARRATGTATGTVGPIEGAVVIVTPGRAYTTVRALRGATSSLSVLRAASSSGVRARATASTTLGP